MAFRLTLALMFKASPVVNSGMSKWAYGMAGFNRYGLWRDDCLYESEDVQDALKRLPPAVRDERTFRIVRAMQLSGAKIILPPDQWTTYEEDVLYLSPLVDQAKREREERERWEQEY